MNSRYYLLGLATVLVVAISYYFVIALPAHNAALLQIERDKFDIMQKELASRHAIELQEKEQRKALLNTCISTAEARYSEY
ncbi:MAG: hypothetical protein Q8909_21335, partial [Bacteroidota bacterium]|nr:hypothetical protein [Bacteroidota bacterium]